MSNEKKTPEDHKGEKTLKEQKEVFLETEGDQFYARNKKWMLSSASEPDSDHILHAVEFLDIKPKKILEIGCGNGWRLHALGKKYGSECYGIEPSNKAVTEGKTEFPNLKLTLGTADSLPYETGKFDMVIIGFCLYLCDRSHLFKIATEIDRVLSDKGVIITLDFHPSFPYRNEYIHHQGIYTYKMNYSRLFSWNPDYCTQLQWVLSHSGYNKIDDVNERISVIVQKKNLSNAYPDNPFI